jgi:5-methylcytosine-specific restriction endonuclease McrA
MRLLEELRSVRDEVRSLRQDLRRIADNDYAVFRSSEQGQLLKQQLYTDQLGKCNDPKCGLYLPIRHLQMDHIKPISKYPSLAVEPTNFQLLCGPCNIDKSNSEELVR